MFVAELSFRKVSGHAISTTLPRFEQIADIFTPFPSKIFVVDIFKTEAATRGVL